jgi:hypothetical protein
LGFNIHISLNSWKTVCSWLGTRARTLASMPDLLDTNRPDGPALLLIGVIGAMPHVIQTDGLLAA